MAKGSNNNNSTATTARSDVVVVPLGEPHQEEHPGRLAAGMPPPPSPHPHADQYSEKKANVNEGASKAKKCVID
jgi:hypothetical protein